MRSSKGCDHVWSGKLPEWISDRTYYNSRCVEESCFSTPHLTFQPGQSGFPVVSGIGNGMEFQGNGAFNLYRSYKINTHNDTGADEFVA